MFIVPCARQLTYQDCTFYHAIDLPGVGTTPGAWDLRGKFQDYVGGVSLAGRTVLDIGTASGFLTFEAEKLGAKVTSMDVDSEKRWNLLPFEPSMEPTARGDLIGQKIRNGYWFAHHTLGSTASALYGDVYDLAGYGLRFDVVILGALLEHLSDPIRALGAAGSVCTDTLVITNRVLDTDDPTAALIGRADTPKLNYSFFYLSRGFLREILGMIGFRIEHITSAAYKYMGDDIELQTVIGRRP